MIVNASSIKLTNINGNLPNMREALYSWFQKVCMVKITKSIVDFQLVEEEKEITFTGVVQPMSPQQVEMKPEGQRQWIWLTIHSTPDLILKPDEILEYNDQRYRVMARLDYNSYGYVEYHIVGDYTE